jgi:hypothetical protein
MYTFNSVNYAMNLVLKLTPQVLRFLFLSRWCPAMAMSWIIISRRRIVRRIRIIGILFLISLFFLLFLFWGIVYAIHLITHKGLLLYRVVCGGGASRGIGAMESHSSQFERWSTVGDSCQDTPFCLFIVVRFQRSPQNLRW